MGTVHSSTIQEKSVLLHKKCIYKKTKRVAVKDFNTCKLVHNKLNDLKGKQCKEVEVLIRLQIFVNSMAVL